MANFCPNCGAKIREGVKFCGFCGEKISDASSPKIELQKSSPAQINDSQPSYTPPESTPVESTSLSAVKNHMRKILALIGILVIVGVAAYFAINQSDEAIGEFYLGMSKDEADRKFGAGTPQGAGYIYSYGSGNFWLTFDSHGKADFINCSNVAMVKTKKGIHVGSTLDEVKRAYGNDYELKDHELLKGIGLTVPAYIYTLGNSRLVFFIDKEDHVYLIRLER